LWSNLASILKPTLAKIALFILLLGVGLGPMFFYGNGPALIVPVVEIFWLAGIAQALGVPVAVNGGVDAFNLVPPNGIGMILIVVGSAISLALNYAVASFIVWSRS
jgi:hypothetical protein